MTSHYEILGVSRLSTTKEIKQAYRRIALTCHPDKVNLEQREEATKKFQDVQVAYHTLENPKTRREYDREVFGEERVVYTPPGSFYESNARPWSWFGRGDLPPTPESSGQGREGSWSGSRNPPHSETSFDSKREFQEYERRPKLMTFLEATLLFHPEDRRHLWLCSEEDDPAMKEGRHKVKKKLHVSLQEIFCCETIELSIFRYRYLEDNTKVVELIRTRIKLKPFLADVLGRIDLPDMGNEFPPEGPGTQRSKQRLSIVPVDESQMFGENYDGQFFRHNGSYYDVQVQHTVYKDDLRIDKHFFSFELLIPSLNGTSVVARFRGRLKRGQFTTVLRQQGMWGYYEGGPRGDLYVELTVK